MSDLIIALAAVGVAAIAYSSGWLLGKAVLRATKWWKEWPTGRTWTVPRTHHQGIVVSAAEFNDEFLRSVEALNGSSATRYDTIVTAINTSPALLKAIAEDCPFPHCDSLVLHRPGTCVYCDNYPKAQEAREADGINFTGEHYDWKETCPSEVRRPLEVIERWGGNRPYPKEDK